jgi:hypothetical protein
MLLRDACRGRVVQLQVAGPLGHLGFMKERANRGVPVVSDWAIRLVPMGYRPPIGPAQAGARREAGGREREGGSNPAGREWALSPRSRPRWQPRGGGRQAGGGR